MGTLTRKGGWPLVVLLCGGLLLVSCSRRSARMGGQDDKRPLVRFSHAKHNQMGVPCSKCHAGVAEAEHLTGKYGPTKPDCKQCHEQVYKPTQCTMCHVGTGTEGTLRKDPPTANLIFSHKAHVPRAKDCKKCHAEVVRGTSLATLPSPKMKDCFGCHNHLEDYRKLRCGSCHKNLSRAPIKFISAFRHEGNFLKEHGRRARPQADLCRQCHTQSFCADCHSQRQVVVPGLKQMERGDRQFIHRGDWIGRHAMESSGKPGTCTRCHSPKQCEACHRKAGVAQRLSVNKKSRTPHPTSWLNPMSPNNHGFAARRRITQCAACHDRGPQSNCIRCHSSVSRGGQGINPHPPGFSRGGKNRHRVCKLCHQ